MHIIGRRTFLIGSGALALAACSSSGGGAATTIDGSDESVPEGGFILARRFATDVLVPGTLRLPFSLASQSALLSGGPAELSGRIVDSTGAEVVASITAKRRTVNEALSYWDFHPTLNEVGTYTLLIENGDADGGAFMVNDPSTVRVPYPGQPLPPFDTPTTADGRGVDPICTRLDGGPCPFHDVTLTEALASGKPVAYLIGTPAHCEIGSCAPGLEELIEQSKRLGDRMVFVHAEVYTDDTATVSTEAVEAYSLAFEPVLFVADATGAITARLDAMWDSSELVETLDAALDA